MSILITPREEREDYPYRRIWRTSAIEILILLGALGAIVIADRVVKVTFAGSSLQILRIGFALLPLLLWLVISYRGERIVREPRNGILLVVFLSALAANAIGVPLIDRFLAIDEWLTNASGTTRLLGFILSVGMIQQFIQYAVVRYSVWNIHVQKRTDGIAYMMASAIGYATVLNLNYALSGEVSLLALSLRVVETTLSQYAISTVLGYALSILKISDGSLFGLPLSLILAATLTSLSATFRAGLIVGSVSATSTANNALQGIGFSVLLVLILFNTYNFVINNAEERGRQRSRGSQSQFGRGG